MSNHGEEDDGFQEVNDHPNVPNGYQQPVPPCPAASVQVPFNQEQAASPLIPQHHQQAFPQPPGPANLQHPDPVAYAWQGLSRNNSPASESASEAEYSSDAETIGPPSPAITGRRAARERELSEAEAAATDAVLRASLQTWAAETAAADHDLHRALQESHTNREAREAEDLARALRLSTQQQPGAEHGYEAELAQALAVSSREFGATLGVYEDEEEAMHAAMMASYRETLEGFRRGGQGGEGPSTAAHAGPSMPGLTQQYADSDVPRSPRTATREAWNRPDRFAGREGSRSDADDEKYAGEEYDEYDEAQRSVISDRPWLKHDLSDVHRSRETLRTGAPSLASTRPPTVNPSSDSLPLTIRTAAEQRAREESRRERLYRRHPGGPVPQAGAQPNPRREEGAQRSQASPLGTEPQETEDEERRSWWRGRRRSRR